MNNIEALYYIRDAIICVGVLAGFLGATLLFIRRKVLPGSLALMGFTLLGIEPILDIVLWRILGREELPDWNTLNTVYACTSGSSLFLGLVLLAAGLFLAAHPETPRLPGDSTGRTAGELTPLSKSVALFR
jgi:hypothetical protein